ncbi:MAG: hypothetical protein IKZ45_03330 [Fibrobacter sp.]|nr:hypothetical protein [Fibrobacter sp.]
MITRTLTALALSTGVAAASVADNQEQIASKVDSANAHRGLEVTGAIRGVAQASYSDNDQDTYGKNVMPDVERNEFVNADFNFGFRPFESVRANAMLRLYAGMQDYFASAAKIIEVPWLNVEGQIGSNFHWIVGDFRQQYSPLTLFAPDVDIMYEPQVFARKRQMAEKQQLLEGNQRNLQGVNLQFRADLNDVFGQVRAEGIFARVNRAQAIDLSGAEGNILPNDSITGATQASNTDKFLLAGNLELLPLKKNAYLGGTMMFIFDNEDSYTYTYRHFDDAGNLSINIDDPYRISDINPFERDPQNTMILAGRVGGDVAGMMNNNNLILDATAEFAMSTDDVYTKRMDFVFTTADDPTMLEFDVDNDGKNEYLKTGDDGLPIFKEASDKESKGGIALNATLNAGYKTDSWGVRLVGDVVFNDSLWFNNLAQSPKFFAQRVLNSDYDGATVKYGVNSPLYSTFDALYNFAPKFSPVPVSMKTDDNGFKAGQTESYNIAPYNKNSWTGNVYSKSQLLLLQMMADPAIQMILPNGMATSNREGGRGNLIANVGDWLEAQGLFGIYTQVSPLFGFSSVSYMEYGGGLKADIFKLIGFKKPLEISGSYRHTERSMEFDPTVGRMDLSTDGVTPAVLSGTGEFKTDFINAGLYVQYLPRLGVTAGFQMVTMELNDLQQKQSFSETAGIASMVPMVKGTQMQWMVGLDYTLDKNAWLSLNFGMVTVENTYNTDMGSPDDAVNLPVYAENVKTDAGWPKEFTSKFSQTIVEASINVEF